ncbi:hypothetical protein VNO78_04823 [Psophocarpus tetragonolobus]|uniref:Uncharacterized protein n=1 Tax=Psophocarpus tetragonolobus TaxID=3891 RepID=A0AAN9XXX2_PSOTE
MPLSLSPHCSCCIAVAMMLHSLHFVPSLSISRFVVPLSLSLLLCCTTVLVLASRCTALLLVDKGEQRT